MELAAHHEQVWHTSVDSSGRVLVPVELRQQLGAIKGSALVWVKSHEHGVQLKTFEQSLVEIQDYYMSLSPPDEIWSEELIRERRREAERE